MQESLSPLILIIVFIIFILYNFRIRSKLIYIARIDGKIKLLILAIGLVFIFLSYLGGNQPINYFISIFALIFIYSGLASGGINEDGIYYRSRGFLIRYIDWEEITDFKIKGYNLESVRIRKINIYVDQLYEEFGLDYIRKKVEKKINI